MKDNIAELKEIDLLEYIQSIKNSKIKKLNNNTYRINPCPICGHNDDFTIYQNTNSYTSFNGCSKGGSIIDFYMDYHKVDKLSAITNLKQYAKIEGNNNKIEHKKIIQKSNKVVNFTDLINELAENKTDYFINRGLSQKTILKYKLGYHKKGFNYAIKKLNGMLEEKENYIMEAYKYFLPIWDNDGQCRYFISRLDDTINLSVKPQKTHNLKGFNIRLFNDQLLSKISDNKYIFITEGIFDALSIEEFDYESIALNSVSNANKLVSLIKENISNLDNKTFILVPDNDKAGTQLKENLLEQFKLLNLRLEIFNFNDKYKDINEYLKDNKIELKNELEIFIKNITKENRKVNKMNNTNNAFSTEKTKSFNIDELTEDTITKKEVFKHILSIESNFDKEELLTFLENKAKQFKKLPEFKRLYKAFHADYIKSKENKIERVTEVTEFFNKYINKNKYTIENGCVNYIDNNGNKTNILNGAMIAEEEIYCDNGQDREIKFKISFYNIFGKKVDTTIIPARDFEKMDWVTTNFGISANISEKRNSKNQLRHCIQCTGEWAKKTNLYTHTGFRKINDELVFLHSGGSIGGKNINVELEGSLNAYDMSINDDIDKKEALKNAFDFINIAKPEIMFPLISTVYLSPLYSRFEKEHVPSYLLNAVGKTGSFKSEIVALGLSHFGNFNGRNLPGSFKDTTNSLEKKMFLIKDMLFCVDDFHPQGKQEVIQMTSIMQSLSRSAGNRSSRGRLKSDTTLRETYNPNCLVITTSEYIADVGESGLARQVILEFNKGDIDQQKLTQGQQNKESFKIAMSEYIKWIAEKDKQLKESLSKRLLELRNMATNNNLHSRAVSNIAHLQLGFQMFLQFFVKEGVCNIEEAQKLQEKAWNVFHKVLNRQNEKMEEDKPVNIFTSILSELLESNKVTVLNVSNPEQSQDSNTFAGYEDNEYYYLLPDTIYSKIYEQLRRQDKIFPVSKDMLIKHLDEAGYISCSKDKRTKLKKINGKPVRFIWLIKSKFESIEKIEEEKNKEREWFQQQIE